MKTYRFVLKTVCLFLLFLTEVYTVSLAHAQGSMEDLEVVRQRVRQDILEGSIEASEVEELINQLQNDGSWTDINYQDVSRTGFEHSRHLSNMLVMSRAFQQKTSSFYQDEALRKAILKAVDFWLEHDFICDNWWWNQIGTPRGLLGVYLVMDEHISEDRKMRGAPIIGRAHLDAWGARPGGDRIKIAAILGKSALLNRDTATLRKVIDTMNEEIHFAHERGTPEDKRGLQTDFSFHHRKDRVTSTLSYGLGYAKAFADWAAKVAGTNYHFSDESMRLLVDFFLDGISKTSVYGKYPDPGAKNRSISREGTLKAYNALLPEQLIKATDYRKGELQKIIQARKGHEKPAFTFNKFFWHTEYMSHQRPEFFTSVRMFSNRNHSMEVPYNGEGVLNHHLGEGANFISVSGQEYFNIFPVWDWQKIPGTTVVQKPSLPSEKEIQKRGLTDFVGGVTDGQYGAAAFDFVSPLDSLRARKAWFFFDNAYVCLGSGIHSDQPLPVVTTLNQSHLDGEVSYARKNRPKIVSTGSHQLKKVKWVYHDSVAYIFPKRNTVHLLNDTATGNWKKISRQHDSSAETITEAVFKLWVDHGLAPRDASYAYVVAPGISLEEAQEYQKDFGLTILANTPALQAVKHEKLNISQLAFYSPATLKLERHGTLRMQQPGMLMLMDNDDAFDQISVSDPSRNLRHISFSLEGAYDTSAEYVTLQQKDGLTHFEVELPQGEYAGQSVTFAVEKGAAETNRDLKSET